MSTFTSLLSEPWLHRFAWVLLHFFWQGTIIALLLSTLLQFLGKSSAQIRYLTVCAALLACCLAPLATWFILPSAAPREDVPAASQAVPQNIALSPTFSESPAASLPSRFQPSSNTRLDNLNVLTSLALTYLTVFWFVGVIVLTLRLMLAWTCIRKIRLNGEPVEEAICLARFQELTGQMRVHYPVRLLQSAWVEVPTLIGWLRPVILLPASALTGLSPEQLASILAHELAHIRRHDYLVNLLQTAIETLLFYYPAIWWIGAKMREEREHCCDDMALEVVRDRFIYASALAHLEEARAFPAALSLSASGGPLLLRIKRIAGLGHRKASAWPLCVLMLLLSLGLCLNWGNAVVPAPPTVVAAKDPSEKLNTLRLENFSVKDMPLDQLVQKLVQDLVAQDPEKQGLNFVLKIPPGEAPLPISLDFSDSPGRRPNIMMILDHLRAKYPLRYKIEKGVIFISQFSQAKIAFDQKASSTLIDVVFNQSNPLEALQFVQTASGSQGFAFDLDMKVIRQIDAKRNLPIINLKARQISVEQALRSICYLADLNPSPMEPFTGYTIRTRSAEAAKAVTYISVGTDVYPFNSEPNEKKRFWTELGEESEWTGPAIIGNAYLKVPSFTEVMFIKRIPSPQGELELRFSVVTNVVEKTKIETTTSLEVRNAEGKSLAKIKGAKTLASSEKAIISFPDPGQANSLPFGIAGVTQVTLIDEDRHPLLPPLSAQLTEIPVYP